MDDSRENRRSWRSLTLDSVNSINVRIVSDFPNDLPGLRSLDVAVSRVNVVIDHRCDTQRK